MLLLSVYHGGRRAKAATMLYGGDKEPAAEALGRQKSLPRGIEGATRTNICLQDADPNVVRLARGTQRDRRGASFDRWIMHDNTDWG